MDIIITKVIHFGQFFMDNLTEHPIITTLTIIGVLTLAIVILFSLKSIYNYILRRKKDLFKIYGPGWAIITGGTDGIGLAYAKQLAARGFDICIIARNPSKLSLKALEIKEYAIKHGKRESTVDVKTVVFDFKYKNNPADYVELGKELEVLGENIAILVNNVGVAYILSFQDFEFDMLNELVSVNIFSQLMLSRIIIPKMLKRDKRTAIVNISSALGDVGFPYFSVYCATKAFNTALSKNLALELKSDNIDIMGVKCGRVNTSRNQHGGKGILIQNAEEAAISQLAQLGYNSETSGSWQHALGALQMYFMPDLLKLKIGKIARTQYIKKEEEILKEE